MRPESHINGAYSHIKEVEKRGKRNNEENEEKEEEEVTHLFSFERKSEQRRRRRREVFVLTVIVMSLKGSIIAARAYKPERGGGRTENLPLLQRGEGT